MNIDRVGVLSMPTTMPNFDGIMFVNTYTRLKISNYRCAADYYAGIRGNARVLVMPASGLGRVMSAIEDTQTSLGNSVQKIDETGKFISAYSNDPAFTRYLNDYCTIVGVAFSESKVIFAGDDTCLYLPLDMWQSFKDLPQAQMLFPPLIKEADAEVFEREVDGQTIRFGGPGVSTGHLRSAIGYEAYREALYCAAKTAFGERTVPILRKTSLVARRLSDETSQRFEGVSVVQLLPEAHPNRHAFQTEIHTDNAFLSLYGDTTRPIAQFLGDYAARHDSYARAYTKLATAFFGKLELPAGPVKLPPKVNRSLSRPVVQQLGPPTTIPIDLPAAGTVRAAPTLDQRSPAALINLDPYIQAANALVLSPPPAAASPQDLRWWAYCMFSVLVAIKTDPRDAEKLAIIMVDSRCLRYAQLYFDLANYGWTDDFPVLKGMRNSYTQTNPASGLRHVQSGLSHFLIVEDDKGEFPLATAVIVVNEIVDHYHLTAPRPPKRYSPRSTTSLTWSAPATADVSFICTSHSERADMHSDCASIGLFLASNGYSAVWPGNDRNNMKSLYGALRHCPRLIGVITEHLADAATGDGTIPPCSSPLMVAHIYDRMIALITLAKINLIFPVGLGGVLEICCRLVLDDYFPLLRERPAIFYSPAHARWSASGADYITTVVSSLLSTEGHNQMIFGRFIDEQQTVRPYHYAATMDELTTIISRFLRQHQ